MSKLADDLLVFVTDDSSPLEIPRPSKVTRRRLLKSVLGLGAVSASGVYAREVEPFWVDWHDYPLPIPNLPKAFDGFRMMQLTDLHASDAVPMNYLRRVIRQAIQAKPDLVVVTGDLVTHALEFVVPICDALGEFTAAGIQTVTSLGNHDYNFSDSYPGMPTRIADAIESRLLQHKIPTLRNAWMCVEHNGSKLCLVGLEDLWSGRFNPQIAFAGVDFSNPIIALSHNPDTSVDLDAYGVSWTLSGHTHGGQVRVPGVGQLVFNVHNREFQQGEYKLPHSRLYVSRGVGYFKQVRLFCRPEVPTFVLRNAEA